MKKLILFISIFAFYFICPAQNSEWDTLNIQVIKYYTTGKYEKAISYGQQALNAAEKQFGKNHKNYTSSLNNLAAIYDVTNQFDKAEPLYLELVKIDEIVLAEGDPGYDTDLINLGELYRKMGMYNKAEPLFLKSLKIRKRVLGENHLDYSISLHELALLYQDMGYFEKSEALYLEAAKNYKNILGETHPDYAALIGSLALLYQSMGNYKSAEPLLIEASEIFKTNMGENHPDYATSLNNLALLYKSIGYYNKAEPLYLEASKIFKHVLGENHPKYAESLHSLALLYWAMGSYDKAEPLFLKAYNILKTTLGEAHPNYAKLLNNYGCLYESMGNYDKAESFYLKASEIWKTVLGDKHPDYVSSLNNLALLYQHIGNFAKAEPYFKQANDGLNEQISQNFSFMCEKEKELFVKTIEYNFDIYLSFALRYKKQKPDFVVLNYNNELAHKGMILQSSILLQQVVKNSNNPNLIATYDNLLSIKKMLSRENTLPNDKRTLKTDSLENLANTLEKSIITKMQKLPGFENLKTLNSATTWLDVQKSLKPGEAAIEFASFRYRNDEKWTDSIYYCALVLCKEFKYPKMIFLFEERQLQAILPTSNGNSSGIDNLYSLKGTIGKTIDGYLLYKLIWQPIESVLHGIKTIYIAPSGLLHKISFSAIATPDSVFLSDKYKLQTISTTAVLTKKIAPFTFGANIKTVIYGGINYSTSIADMEEQSIKYSQKSEQVFSTRSFIQKDSTVRGGEWGYLPGTLKEAEGIDNLFATAKLNHSLISAAKANEESFKSLSGTASPAIIHIATHGFFFPDPEKNYNDIELKSATSFQVSDNPLQRSGLLFSGANSAWSKNNLPANIEDGVLTASEISQMYLPDTKLVVMSACETGLGDIKGGEGVFGLQRAFKMAGVSYIIMSLWQVPDEQTAELMQTFYKNWLAGKAVREAFTTAQNQLKNKYRDSPFMWAAFVLME